ncbi:hypothetical protein [Streptomyces sp. NPDC014734]|uniref:hypothetical protein n=1 Tax=Streptomyces sp. NPDC014734 TaxID=3364886 RepID=UPI0036F81642
MGEWSAEAGRAGGRFVLHRFNGDEVYRLRSAVMWVCAGAEREAPVTLWFEAEADPDGALRCEDTADLRMAPNAEVGVELPGVDVDALVGREFVVPGVADGEDSCMSLLYYCEHQHLRDNRITVVSRDGGGDGGGERFRLRWSAVTEDVNHYDGSKAPTRVEIEGDFLFRGPGA